MGGTHNGSWEPSYWDYVKAAFSLRVPIPGLGGFPVNWLYLLGVGVAGVALPPLWLVGAAGELALLAFASSHPRFQRAIRAQLKQAAGHMEEAKLGSMVQSLSVGSQSRSQGFDRQCEEILEIARKAGANPTDLETYSIHLAELREVYTRMLGLTEMFARYSADWKQTDPLPQIGVIEKELADQGLSDSMRRSRQATLDTLRKRAKTREAISERSHLVSSEITRLEQQVALLRDQALLTRDPSVLTENMDSAAGILEEHTNWLQENAVLLQGIAEQQQQTIA
jgi:hypothetical protein